MVNRYTVKKQQWAMNEFLGVLLFLLFPNLRMFYQIHYAILHLVVFYSPNNI